jgi:hypothetical protein
VTEEMWEQLQHNNWEVCYTSKHQLNNRRPHWRSFIVRTHVALHDRVDWPLKIKVRFMYAYIFTFVNEDLV